MNLRFDPSNIIVSGVGGQGNILASDLISRALCASGCFVSVGETYGATQRGGSVVSHIRVSTRRIYGPLIPSGLCHMIIGFEPLEVYRILKDCGHDDVWVVMNDRPFYPIDVLKKKSTYPEMDSLLKGIGELSSRVKVIKATDIAFEAGNPQAQNVVMVGAFAGLNWIPLDKSLYFEAIRETFSGERLMVNQRAFEMGFAAAGDDTGVSG